MKPFQRLQTTHETCFVCTHRTTMQNDSFLLRKIESGRHRTFFLSDGVQMAPGPVFCRSKHITPQFVPIAANDKVFALVTSRFRRWFRQHSPCVRKKRGWLSCPFRGLDFAAQTVSFSCKRQMRFQATRLAPYQYYFETLPAPVSYSKVW